MVDIGARTPRPEYPVASVAQFVTAAYKRLYLEYEFLTPTKYRDLDRIGEMITRKQIEANRRNHDPRRRRIRPGTPGEPADPGGAVMAGALVTAAPSFTDKPGSRFPKRTARPAWPD
jgi:hypothetical protein